MPVPAEGIISVLNGLVDGINKGLEIRQNRAIQDRKLKLEEQELGVKQQIGQQKSYLEAQGLASLMAQREAGIEKGKEEIDIKKEELGRKRKEDSEDALLKADRAIQGYENDIGRINKEDQDWLKKKGRIEDDIKYAKNDQERAGFVANLEIVNKRLSENEQRRAGLFQSIEGLRGKKSRSTNALPNGGSNSVMPVPRPSGLSPVESGVISKIQSATDEQSIKDLLNQVGNQIDDRSKASILEVSKQRILQLRKGQR